MEPASADLASSSLWLARHQTPAEAHSPVRLHLVVHVDACIGLAVMALVAVDNPDLKHSTGAMSCSGALSP